MADEILENLKMWTADPLCVAAAKRVEDAATEIERLRAENDKLRTMLDAIVIDESAQIARAALSSANEQSQEEKK